MITEEKYDGLRILKNDGKPDDRAVLLAEISRLSLALAESEKARNALYGALLNMHHTAILYTKSNQIHKELGDKVTGLLSLYAKDGGK